MTRAMLQFPRDFLWGAATASYQVEGGATADGRGSSIWDAFTRVNGAIADGASGDVACDHFHRYAEDVALMAELGLPAYRFSIAWSRVMPDGATPSPRGLDFYHRLTDELLANGIEPVVTLYHWDLPQAVEDDGGWLDRDTAARFADYAAHVHSGLADRVDRWTTINEPFCAAFLGYGSGVHAPGRTDKAAALVAGHHLMLAHGRAMRALRSQARPGDSLSIALNFSPAIADGDTAAHREAARKFDGIHNRFFLDPLLGKGYPDDVLADVEHLPGLRDAIADGDLEVLAEPIDWLGVNYYAPTRVTPLDDPRAASNCPLPGLLGMDVLPPRGKLTSFGWEQAPDSFTDLLCWLDEYTGIPLVVAENGAAFTDTVSADGAVHDPERADYYTEHLRAVHRAVSRGADVRGYLAWSLLDNFEWAMGYTQRFGLVHVDFDTLRRTVKDSGRHFSRIIAANAVPAAST
ncbi:GH1 family beta-glucosidase [Amycolatopsis suaedae]|uniref:Beta-glucosidase n=1 Tax=Amycolatopsis suaedae TaxID=2510978 RepID=A0A4Q7J189_9PSEU|nr:GH1 family beta-glucosidase [Amycolatopsis suaedae]RZQ60196.1 beta-glucosidase [Amycolatopsis suaedae]